MPLEVLKWKLKQAMEDPGNKVTATPEDARAAVAITVNGAALGNGSAATWSTGENVVTITVTNGSLSKVYTVTVTK